MLFSSRSYILTWCVLLFSCSLFFLVLTFYHVFSTDSIQVTLDFLNSTCFRMTVVVCSTLLSSLFSFSVCLIALVVFSFSMFYITTSVKLPYFMWLTFLFVMSILILLNFSDLFFVMLGWDGLGVVSFFLILFYQRRVSIFSAAFTLLINRIGDALLVLVVVLLIHFSPFLGFTLSSPACYTIVVVLFLGLSTKRALFPFSPWLPAAMAAPTPISSLVHSSTLVTAGLYLIMRNFVLLSQFPGLLNIVCLIGLFTSFYAGLSSLVETDTKKVVALSTLRHLGFIAFSLGLGWCSLAFLHLLAHAFFKSSLFMAVGSFITSHYHYQESRYFSSFSRAYPFYSRIILVREANLLGFPFISGFYSKDFILESYSFRGLSYALVLVAYCNVVFTFIYSFRILNSMVSTPKIASYQIVLRDVTPFIVLIFILSSFSIVFSFFYFKISSFILPIFFPPFVLKFLPFVLLLLVSSCFLLYLTKGAHLSSPSINFFSRIFFLAYLWPNLKHVFTNLSYLYNRSSELGVYHWFIVTFLVESSFKASLVLNYFFKVNFRFSMVYTVIVFIIILSFVFLQ